ncbi:MAG: hypothetical protein ABIW17_01055 [Marmoricola sp.]
MDFAGASSFRGSSVALLALRRPDDEAARPVPGAATTTSSWAQTTLDTLEQVWSVEVSYMGQAPLPDGGTSNDPDNPDSRLDVFLQNVGPQGIYGFWFMEGTAVWMEDQVYDSINDSYQCLATSPIRHPRTSLDSSGHLDRQQFWDAAVGSPSALHAIYEVVGDSQWPTFFATFGSWNTLPAGSYSELSGYPSPVWRATKTLTSPSTGWRTVGITGLADSTVLLRPGPKLSTRKQLTVAVNGASLAAGTATLLQRRYREGT